MVRCSECRNYRGLQHSEIADHFVEVLGELHAAGDSAHHLRLEIYMYFFAFQSGAGSKFYAKGFRKRYDGATRIQQVRPFIETDGDVAQLFDKERGKTMVVVGAGPSVTLRADALRKRRDEVCVVSTLSALAAGGRGLFSRLLRCSGPQSRAL